MLILAEMALRNRAGQQGAGGASVLEECAALEGLVFGLVVHVLAACGGEN
jgi:hypothetical protein